MTIPPLSSSEDESARSQPSDRRADALSVGLDVERAAPICRLDRDTGQPAWAQIVDLFNRYGLKGPPTKLRDELVVHLMWARYGEALDAATTPSDPSTAWRGISSAPKDGTQVDLWADGARWASMTWQPHHEAWGRYERRHKHTVMIVYTSLEPTHWMPLPGAPS